MSTLKPWWDVKWPHQHVKTCPFVGPWPSWVCYWDGYNKSKSASLWSDAGRNQAPERINIINNIDSFRGFFALGVFKGRLNTIIVEFNGQPTNQTSPTILIISLFFKDKNNMEQNFTININRNSESKPHRQHPYPTYPNSNFNWATLSSHQLELSSVIYLLI